MNSQTSIILIRPKFPHNIGAAVRAASCWGIEKVIFTGDRITSTIDGKKGNRIPREERMKAYRSVNISNMDDPFSSIPKDSVPIAVEISPSASILFDFEHPENASYIFGPEDGSLDRSVTTKCHYHIAIPMRACSNLAAAVNMVMYDRACKEYLKGNRHEVLEYLRDSTRGSEVDDSDYLRFLESLQGG